MDGALCSKRRLGGSRVPRGALWGTLGGYALQARKVDPVASALVVPYLGWVSFAGLLNAAVVRKNPKWLMAG